ncbi:HEAT repeat domain-containing protein [Pontibacter sp. Tf4]|uniref:HEAT repeat domain-containing protein n=1 Tax=Pontibacter sp. Tf4 TaxID=2761620 RepID=UPI001625CE71|nr:HEAT repeat domain-containing protein [Pontibacter sp. Tf4]MBB6612383.1 HEAT repeat domain-containing protein [Pontibacter sp. Tf4]
MLLQTELAKFWSWAGMTPETYNEERGLGEWETAYPGWDALYKAAVEALEQLNTGFNHDLAQQLVYALAIDNEQQVILQKVEELLESKLRFVKKAINSDQPQARWQAAELLGRSEVEDREKLLANLINRDADKYVKRRALMSLSKVNHATALEFAKGFVKDPDPFLKLVAKEIIKQKV